MVRYVVTARLLIEAGSTREAITVASEAIDAAMPALLDYDFVGDAPAVEISEHQLTQHPRGYLCDAAKAARRH